MNTTQTQPTVNQLLRHARATLDNPQAWGRQYCAKDREHNPVAPDSPNACSWCSLGAIMLAALHHGIDAIPQRELPPICHQAAAAVHAQTPQPRQGLTIWNDALDTFHPDVLRAFDAAIIATNP